jgi:predicted nucleic acid-binding protein
MIVIDASAVLEILRGSETGRPLDIALSGALLHAPHLIDLEIANVIRKWESRGNCAII